MPVFFNILFSVLHQSIFCPLTLPLINSASSKSFICFLPAWLTIHTFLYLFPHNDSNIYEIRCIHDIKLTFTPSFFPKALLVLRQIFLGNVDNLDFHRSVVKLEVWILTYNTWGQLTVIMIKVYISNYLDTEDL